MPVAEQLCRVVLWRSQVTVQDAVVAATRAQEAIVPSDGADATIVASQRLEEFIFGCVPDLELARVRPNSEESAVSGPLHARDTVIRPDVTQLGHFAVLSGPEVDTGTEAHGQNILRGPVD